MSEQIKITIGAVKSASVGRAFESIKADAVKLAKYLDKLKLGGGTMGAMEQDGDKAGKTIFRSVNAAAKRLELAGRRVSVMLDDSMRRALALGAGGGRGGQFRAAPTRSEILQKQLGRLRAREQMDSLRNKQQFAGRVGSRFGRYLSHSIASAPGMVRRGLNGELAQGIGIGLDPSSSLINARSNRYRAQKLANLGYNPMDRTDGNNKRRTAQDVLGAVGATTGKAKFLTDAEVLSGIDKFVSSTGSLSAAMASAPMMAELTAATGSTFEDMAGNYAAVTNMYKKMRPNMSAAETAEAVDSSMRTLGGQSKLGSVEIKDLSDYLSRLTASSPFYGADPAKTLADLGAMMQLSKAGGGSATPREASMAVARFTSSWSKPERQKAFTEFTGGKSVFDEHGQLRPASDIVKEAVAGTDGDSSKFSKIIVEERALKAANDARSTYLEAKKQAKLASPNISDADAKAAGVAAMNARDIFGGAYISKSQSSEDMRLLNATSEAASIDFQRKIDKVSDEFLQKLMPAVERLTPELIALTDAASRFAGWAIPAAIDNPILAGGAVVAGAGALSLGGGLIEGIGASLVQRSMLKQLSKNPSFIASIAGLSGGGAARVATMGAASTFGVAIPATATTAATAAITTAGAALAGAVTALGATIVALDADLKSKGGSGLFDMKANVSAVKEVFGIDSPTVGWSGDPKFVAGDPEASHMTGPDGKPVNFSYGDPAAQYQSPEKRFADSMSGIPGVRLMTPEEVQHKAEVDEQVKIQLEAAKLQKSAADANEKAANTFKEAAAMVASMKVN